MKKTIILGILSAILVLLLSNLGFLKEGTNALESKILDKKYELRGGLLGAIGEHSKLADQIVILKIDEKSLDKLGRYYDWPRSYYATLVDSLRQCDAKAIGFDIIFADPSKNRMVDSLLAQKAKEHGAVFYSLHLSEDESEEIPEEFIEKFSYDFPQPIVEQLITNENMEIPISELNDVAAGVGNVTLVDYFDGVNRSFPLFISYQGKAYASFGFELARHYLGVPKQDVEIKLGKYVMLGDVRIPIDNKGTMLINYLGNPRESIRSYSIADFITGEINSKNISLENQIVLIGATAAGLYDLRITPVSKALPGIFIHANIIQNIIQGPFLRKYSFWVVVIATLLLSIITAFITNHMKVFYVTASVIFLILIYFAFSVYLFEAHNRWLEVARPVFGIVIAFTSTMTYRYLTEEKQKRFIKNTFQHYLTPSVVNKLMEKPEMLKLGGEKRNMSVLFSDIQGFTTISEMMEAEKLVELLNQYLTEMTNIVLNFDGTLDKYEGDAIMAFWNAPLDQPNHAVRACYSALEMQNTLSKMREKWQSEGKIPLYARVGINSGDMVVGNMGSKKRFDYTVMGDSVNLGSRLESANKQYNTYIMISETTYNQAKDKIEVRYLDELQVKGKTESVKVYELLAKKDELSDEMKEILKHYNSGIEFYSQREWDEAIKCFENALKINKKDGPSRVYLQRSKKYKENPPDEAWEAVTILGTK